MVPPAETVAHRNRHPHEETNKMNHLTVMRAMSLLSKICYHMLPFDAQLCFSFSLSTFDQPFHNQNAQWVWNHSSAPDKCKYCFFSCSGSSILLCTPFAPPLHPIVMASTREHMYRCDSNIKHCLPSGLPPKAINTCIPRVLPKCLLLLTAVLE